MIAYTIRRMVPPSFHMSTILRRALIVATMCDLVSSAVCKYIYTFSIQLNVVRIQTTILSRCRGSMFAAGGCSKTDDVNSRVKVDLAKRRYVSGVIYGSKMPINL